MRAAYYAALFFGETLSTLTEATFSDLGKLRLLKLNTQSTGNPVGECKVGDNSAEVVDCLIAPLLSAKLIDICSFDTCRLLSQLLGVLQ